MKKYLFLSLALGIVFLSLFLLMFRSPLFSSMLLFYRGCYLTALSFLFSYFLFLLLSRLSPLKARMLPVDFFVGALILVATSSLWISFFVVVPVTIDRSVSTFLLSTLDIHDAGMTKDELRSALVHDYVDHRDAVARRMSEQLISHNIVVEGDRYKLSPQGRNFLKFARLTARVLGMNTDYVQASSENSGHPVLR